MGDFLEGEAVFRKREGGGSLGWQQRVGTGSGTLPCQGFSVGSEMKGSSQTWCFRSISVGEGKGHVLQNTLLCLFFPFKQTKIPLL